MKTGIACLFSLLTATFCAAQDIYTFKEGLILSDAYRYAREAVYTDIVGYQFYTNTQKRPAAGDSIQVDKKGKYSVWQAAIADSLDRFRGRMRGFGGSNYLYLTYQSDKN